MKSLILALAFFTLFVLGGMMVLFENPLGPYLILISVVIGLRLGYLEEKNTLP